MKGQNNAPETAPLETPSHSFYDKALKVTIDSPKVMPLQWLQAAAAIALILVVTEIAIVKGALTVNNDVTEIISVNDNSLYND